MSRTAKIFLGSSIVLSSVTVWGVHFLQKRESENMYQGVVRDEARLKARAEELARLSTPALAPLNTPGAPVQQPAAVIDEDCLTCNISPPPQLVEQQSKEARQQERKERMLEYEAQKGLGKKLEKEQGVER